MKRYSNYLNKCMFIAQDDFIKKKFKAFLDLHKTVKGETFFERMQKDTLLRQEKEKLRSQMNQSKHPGFMSSMDKTSQRGGETTSDSESAMNSKLGTRRRGAIVSIFKNSPKNLKSGKLGAIVEDEDDLFT